MENSAAGSTTEATTDSSANIALAVSLVALAVWIALAAADADGPIWLAVLVLGGAGAFLGWRTGGGARPTGRGLAALVIGGIAFAAVVLWMVVAAITGDL